MAAPPCLGAAAARFTEDARKQFVPAFRDFLLPFLRSMPPAEEVVLVSEKETDKGIDRVYRVRHGARAQTWASISTGTAGSAPSARNRDVKKTAAASAGAAFRDRAWITRR